MNRHPQSAILIALAFIAACQPVPIETMNAPYARPPYINTAATVNAQGYMDIHQQSSDDDFTPYSTVYPTGHPADFSAQYPTGYPAGNPTGFYPHQPVQGPFMNYYLQPTGIALT